VLDSNSQGVGLQLVFKDQRYGLAIAVVQSTFDVFQTDGAAGLGRVLTEMVSDQKDEDWS
jgi:hypothetical protein